MKILGVDNSSSNTKYIVEISHDEVCAVMNKARYSDNSLKELKAGTDFDISIGYDFKNDIGYAMKKMQEAYEQFSKASNTMQEFVKFANSQETNNQD